MTAETPGGRPICARSGSDQTTSIVTAAKLATVAAASGNSEPVPVASAEQVARSATTTHRASTTVAAHLAQTGPGPPARTLAVERQKDWPVPQIDAVRYGSATPTVARPDVGHRPRCSMATEANYDDGRTCHHDQQTMAELHTARCDVSRHRQPSQPDERQQTGNRRPSESDQAPPAAQRMANPPAELLPRSRSATPAHGHRCISVNPGRGGR